MKKNHSLLTRMTAMLLVLGGAVTALLVRLGVELRQWSGRLQTRGDGCT